MRVQSISREVAKAFQSGHLVTFPGVGTEHEVILWCGFWGSCANLLRIKVVAIVRGGLCGRLRANLFVEPA